MKKNINKKQTKLFIIITLLLIIIIVCFISFSKKGEKNNKIKINQLEYKERIKYITSDDELIIDEYGKYKPPFNKNLTDNEIKWKNHYLLKNT